MRHAVCWNDACGPTAWQLTAHTIVSWSWDLPWHRACPSAHGVMQPLSPLHATDPLSGLHLVQAGSSVQPHIITPCCTAHPASEQPHMQHGTAAHVQLPSEDQSQACWCKGTAYSTMCSPHQQMQSSPAVSSPPPSESCDLMIARTLMPGLQQLVQPIPCRCGAARRCRTRRAGCGSGPR